MIDDQERDFHDIFGTCARHAERGLQCVERAIDLGFEVVRSGIRDTDLPGDVVWGPYRIGDRLLVATANEQLVAVSSEGSVAWAAPMTAGDLAGPPLAAGDDVFVAFRGGTLERRSMSDGQVVGSVNVEQPLAAGPVEFLDRIVLTTHDGSLLVIQRP